MNFKLIWFLWFSKDNHQPFYCFDALIPTLALSPAAMLPSLLQSFYSCMHQSIWSCFHLHYNAFAKVSCLHHCYMLPSLHRCIYFFVNPSLYFSTLFLCSTYDAPIPAFLLLPSFDDFQVSVICLPFLWWFHLCLGPTCPALTIVSLLPYFYPWFDPYLLVLMLHFLLCCFSPFWYATAPAKMPPLLHSFGPYLHATISACHFYWWFVPILI